MSTMTADNIDLCSFDRIDACQLIQNRTLLYIIRGPAGFASELNNMLSAFAYSVATKRRFLIDGYRWNYGSFDNYFDVYQSRFTPYLFSNERFNNCIQRTFLLMVNNPDNNDATDHLMISRDETGYFQLLSEVTNYYDQYIFNGLLSIARKRQVTQFLWQYLSKQVIQNMIEDFHKQHSNFSKLSHFYGMHIRRGDKLIMESLAPPKMTNYISGIQQLAAKLRKPTDDVNNNGNSSSSIETVFVASDAQKSVLKELRELRPQWNFVHLDYNNQWPESSYKKSHGHQQNHFNRLSKERKFYETQMFLTELTILSQAHGVVCTFSSNICRLIQLLRKQNEDTLLSLD